MNRQVQAYRQVKAQGWSRVDMVLALYDRTIASIDEGLERIRLGQPEALSPIRARVQRLLLGLIEGMDIAGDETSRQMARVLVFAMQRMADSTELSWSDARRVIVPLREGFAGIREEAIRGEQQGTIPPLDWRKPVACSA
ncbi:flagellar protein FliS [Planctomyces sp. SH-PL14]|uniref:flagellar protein FliS n=1 Tax=Planctomyces sp. SH-PL14 TaxID=1632864 RepID=UPI00078CE745|nr:flagellar protein FliS [Planctomyces sp. SH-PL14]AMV22750.1 hypothetical protein VT03_32955 [Planctomyces sp. SH-PL14]